MDRSPEYQVAFLIVLGTAGMLVLVVAIVLFVIVYQKRILQSQLEKQQLEANFQQKMLEAALESQENERRRIAADLHDSVGAMLATVKLGMGNMLRSGKTEDQDFTRSVLDETISSVRKISRDLMPSTLEHYGLSAALREFCERLQQSSDITFSFIEEGEASMLALRDSSTLYRIVQELVSNAVKHSGAKVVTISLTWKKPELMLVVQDNGCGFSVEEKKKQNGGLGLYNLENRARVLGATLNYNSAPATGTRIELRWNYEKT
ncbi:MAG: sensor histidine kinase [Cyclobacteriaceae bacterium]|nr:sensor histidine kinase [Cyclobacteriaceae bacterium]